MGLVRTAATEILVGAAVANPAVAASADFNVGFQNETKLASQYVSEPLNISLSLPRLRDVVMHQLAALRDGWAGSGTIAPPATVRRDIETALSASSLRKTPDIEVDEDGAVALLWEVGAETLALTFVGNGKVIGTTFPQAVESPAWGLSVTDSVLIAGRLRAKEIAFS